MAQFLNLTPARFHSIFIYTRANRDVSLFLPTLLLHCSCRLVLFVSATASMTSIAKCGPCGGVSESVCVCVCAVSCKPSALPHNMRAYAANATGDFRYFHPAFQILDHHHDVSVGILIFQQECALQLKCFEVKSCEQKIYAY